MKSVLLKVAVEQLSKRWFQFCVLCLIVLAVALTNAKAYQQSPFGRDLEIAQLKARIAELETARLSCFKFKRDPALNEPMWAEQGE
jgi:hypothetical protein